MVQVSYPGVYVEELASGVRTITGVATSITAFIGYTARGVDQKAKRIFNFGDFERKFGGIAADSELSYAVQHFFDNGGTDAYVVRVPKSDAAAASITILDGTKTTAKKAFVVTALSTGAWGNAITVDVTNVDNGAETFDIKFTDTETGVEEKFLKVTTKLTSARYVKTVVNDPDSGSGLVVIGAGETGAGIAPANGTSGGDFKITDVKTDKTYTLVFNCDLPSTGELKDVDVDVLKKDEPRPATVVGLAALLERRIHDAFAKKWPDGTIRVRCEPSRSGSGLQIYVDRLNGKPTDAVIKITAPASGNSALTMLKFGSTDIQVNASRYLLGTGRKRTNTDELAQFDPVAGSDGTKLPMTGDLIGDRATFTGIYALEKVDLFNLLCIPDATRAQPNDPSALADDGAGNPIDPNAIFAKALAYCEERRAFLIIDAPPPIDDAERAAEWKLAILTAKGKNGAAYFPRLRLPDPKNNYRLRTFAPSGVVAGVMARTDGSRGVWKAPAGIDATLNGVQGQVYELTDAEHGTLNPLGLNCFRRFPIYGQVSWGARTLVGADAEASEWKYVPVRRLALFLEETLFRGTKWVVFEPNDEPLWAQIRLNIGAFMHSMFVQGAFAGKTSREAYLVKCDRETTTQDDINRGVVNILVGFAPLKPAEFVVLRIQQLAGQIQT